MNALIKPLNLDAFDILNSAFNEISQIAESAGVSFAKLLPLLCSSKADYKTGIELNKAYKGKVKAWFRIETAKSGQEFPVLTFNTRKHGGFSEIFNGWQWLRENNLVGNNPLSDSEKTAIQIQRAEREKQQAQRNEQAKQDKEKSRSWRASEFKNAQIAFNTASRETVATHPYTLKKGINTDGVDIRRGAGKYGDCLQLAIQNHSGAIVGYQHIYAENPANYETNKFYIIEHEGDKSGGFIVIGDKDAIKDGAIFCEGLATGLSLYHAGGDNKKTFSNADNLPVIVCLDAGNLPIVVESFAKQCATIIICADNDAGKLHGNTGVYVALETAKKYGLDHVFMPVSLDNQAVDFNDTLAFKKLKLINNPLNSVLQLIEYAPKVHLTRLGKRAALAITKLVPSVYSIEQAAAMVNNALENRGDNGEKVKAIAIIANQLRKTLNAVKERNKITVKAGLVCHDLAGLDNQQIARHILENGGGIWLDNRHLGAGKTKLLEALKIALDHLSIAYVSHRVSIINDACKRLNIESYQDVTPIEPIHHLGVCVNSAAKYGLSNRFNVLFLDEFRQILNHVTNGTVDNRKQCLQVLIDAIKKADFIICSDADLNNECVAFLKKHAGGKSLNLIETDAKPYPKTLHLLSNHYASYEAIYKELLAGGKPFVACTAKNEAIKLYSYLIEQGINETTLLLIHSDNRNDSLQSEFTNAPNQHATKYACIIHSPTIGSGVSIEKSHFTTNYLLNSGNLPSNEALQMTARNRLASDIYISFSNQINYDRVTDLELLEQGETDKNNRFADFLEAGKDGYQFSELATLKINITRANNEDKNDFANNFLLLAELNGFSINRDLIAQIPDNPTFNQLADRVKKQLIENEFTAEAIPEAEAKQLKDSGKQSDSNKVNRFYTTVMAGTDDITRLDVENRRKGAMAQLANYETVNGSIDDARKVDIDNQITLNKSSSRLSIFHLFKLITESLLNDGVIINKENAGAACERLTENAAELVVNGLGNYSKRAKKPIITLSRFLKRFGYELVEVSRDRHGLRTYILEVNTDIKRYAENRQALKLNV